MPLGRGARGRFGSTWRRRATIGVPEGFAGPGMAERLERLSGVEGRGDRPSLHPGGQEDQALAELPQDVRGRFPRGDVAGQSGDDQDGPQVSHQVVEAGQAAGLGGPGQVDQALAHQSQAGLVGFTPVQADLLGDLGLPFAGLGILQAGLDLRPVQGFAGLGRVDRQAQQQGCEGREEPQPGTLHSSCPPCSIRNLRQFRFRSPFRSRSQAPRPPRRTGPWP